MLILDINICVALLDADLADLTMDYKSQECHILFEKSDDILLNAGLLD